MTEKGTRLENSGWEPEEKDRSFAIMCKLDPDAVWADFRDFWTAKTGANATKKDWPATWRRWCRNNEGKTQNRGRFVNNVGSDTLMPDRDITRRWVGGRAYSYIDALDIRQRVRGNIVVTDDEREAMKAWNL